MQCCGRVGLNGLDSYLGGLLQSVWAVSIVSLFAGWKVSLIDRAMALVGGFWLSRARPDHFFKSFLRATSVR